MKGLGCCSDGGCLFRRNTGQVTNGGCNCIRNQSAYVGDGWMVPAVRVQLMVGLAVQVALAKERANPALCGERAKRTIP